MTYKFQVHWWMWKCIKPKAGDTRWIWHKTCEDICITYIFYYTASSFCSSADFSRPVFFIRSLTSENQLHPVFEVSLSILIIDLMSSGQLGSTMLCKLLNTSLCFCAIAQSPIEISFIWDKRSLTHPQCCFWRPLNACKKYPRCNPSLRCFHDVAKTLTGADLGFFWEGRTRIEKNVNKIFKDLQKPKTELNKTFYFCSDISVVDSLEFNFHVFLDVKKRQIESRSSCMLEWI